MVGASNRRGVEAQARVERILSVAHELMVRRGYQHASLDEVLRRSGGSKATLVKYFRNKAGLLAAVITGVARRYIEEAERTVAGRAPAAGLQAFGEVMLGFYLQPDSLAIYRGVVTEGPRHRSLATMFYDQGHGRFVASLAAQLARWNAAGLLRSREPAGDADRFLHMIRSGWHERCLIGLGAGLSPAELRRHVRSAVRLFLYGVGAAPRRSSRSDHVPIRR